MEHVQMRQSERVAHRSILNGAIGRIGVHVWGANSGPESLPVEPSAPCCAVGGDALYSRAPSICVLCSGSEAVFHTKTNYYLYACTGRCHAWLR